MADDLDRQIANLKRAMGSGVLTVEEEGSRVTYRSLTEMRQALADLRAEKVQTEGGGRVRTRRVYVNGTSGW